MGHLRFLAFYLITGLAAAATHVFMEPGSQVPIVGASGAISGIMGAYIVLYPHARVKVWTGFMFWMPWWPAWLILGEWFLLQALSAGAGDAEGVAVWAHVGGFIAGAVLVKLFVRRDLVAAKRAGVKLDEVEHGGWW